MTSPAVASRPTVRVLTLNVFGPANPDWERRHRLVAEVVRDLDPDVVALQEVPVTTPDVLDVLLGDGYHRTHFDRPADDGVAGTLATRWPHRVVRRVDLAVGPHVRETLPWAETVIVEADTPVGALVVAHHKPSWPFPAEADREQQALLAIDAIEAHVTGRAVHVVVLGDFDATPDSASLQLWRGRRSVGGRSVCYQDAWEYVNPTDPGFTFDLENPLVRDGECATAVSRRIDHVLVRSGSHGPTLQVVGCRRVLDGPVDGVWASDHYGVLADLALPVRPPGSRS